MRLFKAVLAALFLVALAGCAKPLPADKAAYAGDWSGASVDLKITQEGKVEYKKVDGNSNVSVNSPIKDFAGNNMIVGVGPMSTTFVISAPPHQDGDVWKMTVDGVELTRK